MYWPQLYSVLHVKTVLSQLFSLLHLLCWSLHFSLSIIWSPPCLALVWSCSIITAPPGPLLMMFCYMHLIQGSLAGRSHLTISVMKQLILVTLHMYLDMCGCCIHVFYQIVGRWHVPIHNCQKPWIFVDNFATFSSKIDSLFFWWNINRTLLEDSSHSNGALSPTAFI